jgi:hypothetical protein
LFDDVKEKADKLSKDFEKLRKERKEDASISTNMADDIKKIETENVKMKEKSSNDGTRHFSSQSVNIAKLNSFGYFHFLIDEMSKFVLAVFISLLIQPSEYQVIRFLYYSDLDKVKKAGRNLRGTHFGVNEQFPPEIEERRRKLEICFSF